MCTVSVDFVVLCWCNKHRCTSPKIYSISLFSNVGTLLLPQFFHLETFNFRLILRYPMFNTLFLQWKSTTSDFVTWFSIYFILFSESKINFIPALCILVSLTYVEPARAWELSRWALAQAGYHNSKPLQTIPFKLDH